MTTTKRKQPARRSAPLEGSVRVAVYLRISTDEEHQPYSLGAQDQRLRSYVASQPGWSLVRTYQDQQSGATLERPDLQRALADAKAGWFDLLLVYRVDRLARSVRGLAHILEELDGAGVAFRSATEPFDTSTPAGRMMVQMLGVFAEFERETIIDRVVAGMERKAGRGEWVVGPRPFGYTLPPKGTPGPRHLIVDEDRAPLVAAIFGMYARRRVGSQAIANWLNDQGHRTQRGKPWGHTAVLTILRNRAYLGEVFFRGTWHLAPHPPLVDAALFAEAQALLAERGEDVSKRASNPSEYLVRQALRGHRGDGQRVPLPLLHLLVPQPLRHAHLRRRPPARRGTGRGDPALAAPDLRAAVHLRARLSRRGEAGRRPARRPAQGAEGDRVRDR